MVFIPIFQWYLHYPLVAVNTYYPLDHVNVWIMWNIPGFPWRFHTDPNIYHRRPPTAPAKVCMAPMFPSHEGLPGCLDGVLKRKRWAKRARLCQIMPDFWEIFGKKCQTMPDYARFLEKMSDSARFGGLDSQFDGRCADLNGISRGFNGHILYKERKNTYELMDINGDM